MCALFLSLEVAAVCYLKKNNNNNFSSKFFPPNRVIVPGKIRARCTIEEKIEYIYFFKQNKSCIINA